MATGRSRFRCGGHYNGWVSSKQEISGMLSDYLSWEINTKDLYKKREWLAENPNHIASHIIIDQIKFYPFNKISLVSKNAFLPDISMIAKPPSPPFSYCYGILESDSWSFCQTPCHQFSREDWTHHHNLWSTTSVKKTKVMILKHNIKASFVQWFLISN